MFQQLTQSSRRYLRLAAVLALLAFAGAQLLEAQHSHAGGELSASCVLCHAAGHAVASDTPVTAVPHLTTRCQPASRADSAPASVYYAPRARGPPTLA